MALLERTDALRASPSAAPHHLHEDGADDLFAVNDFDEELRRLSDANRELLDELQHPGDAQAGAAITSALGLAPADAEQMEMLRLENADLRARVQELEALGSGKADELWLERQREYEMLLEEKSEVIRSLHQKIQESQESAIGGDAPPPSPGASSTRVGQAEEILRLKRELEDQRRQLEQDEQDMMGQMRQMELAMAKERAEMARQRQEVQRVQADLTRELEQSGRDTDLKERLNSLRRNQDPKAATATAAAKPEQKSSGFFRRIFG